MKRERIAFAVLCSMNLILAVTSCQNDNDTALTELEQNFEDGSQGSQKHDVQFTLIREDVLNREDYPLRLESAELRSYKSSTPFELSIPLYLYYFHGGEKSDHYFGTEAPSGSSRSINGRSYLYMYQDFNLVRSSSEWVRPLYRHYSVTANDHMLSTQSSVSGYKNQGLLGYIYSSPKVGTIPLREYYSSAKKNHHYVSRNSEVEYIKNTNAVKDYSFQRIIGYVYPGTKEDSQKKPDVITAKIVFLSPCEIVFSIKVKAGNSYRLLSYSKTFNEPRTIYDETASVTLPKSYTIVSIGMMFKFQHSNWTASFSNLESPDMSDQTIDLSRNTSLKISKFAIPDENHLTFEVMEFAAVGNSLFRKK